MTPRGILVAHGTTTFPGSFSRQLLHASFFRMTLRKHQPRNVGCLSFGSQFGSNVMHNLRLVNFVRELRLPHVQISSVYRETAAWAWDWYKYGFKETELRISVWNIPSGKTGLPFHSTSVFLGVPLPPEIFRWNDLKRCVPFSLQLDFCKHFVNGKEPELYSVWCGSLGA